MTIPTGGTSSTSKLSYFQLIALYVQIYFYHAAQVLLQLGNLAQQLHDFLLGEHIEGAVLLHLLQLVQTVHAGAHGFEVGHHAAQPAGVHIVHTAAGRFLLDGLLGLLFCAHEQQSLTTQENALAALTGEL